MSTRVIGYQLVEVAPLCPYCGHRYFALEDDGDPESLKIHCWCGATVRVRRDEPDLRAWPEMRPEWLT